MHKPVTLSLLLLFSLTTIEVQAAFNWRGFAQDVSKHLIITGLVVAGTYLLLKPLLFPRPYFEIHKEDDCYYIRYNDGYNNIEFNSKNNFTNNSIQGRIISFYPPHLFVDDKLVCDVSTLPLEKPTTIYLTT